MRAAERNVQTKREEKLSKISKTCQKKTSKCPGGLWRFPPSLEVLKCGLAGMILPGGSQRADDVPDSSVLPKQGLCFSWPSTAPSGISLVVLKSAWKELRYWKRGFFPRFIQGLLEGGRGKCTGGFSLRIARFPFCQRCRSPRWFRV